MSLSNTELENIIVLVEADSPNKLQLTDDCKNKLLGDEEGPHTLEFVSQSNMVLGYHREIFLQYGKSAKVIRIGLVDRPVDEESNQGDVMEKWSFNDEEQYLSTMIEREEYVLDVHYKTYEEGSCINVVHFAEKDSMGDSHAFTINPDGSISPQYRSASNNLYLGVKGKMTDNERKNFLNMIQNSGTKELQNDNANGYDTLGEDVVAQCLANQIAGKGLKPPFAIGLFGEWGAGKSTFFELMKKQVIKIQKMKVPRNETEMKYAGHIYCVEFSAWTYYRGDNIWASLMYRILNDLNDQLELERLLKVSNEGGFSSIEINELLNKGEREYLRELLKKDQGEIKNLFCNVGNGIVSKSLEDIFANNAKQDKEDLNQAKEEKADLMLELRQYALNKTENNTTNIVMKIIVQKVLEKMKTAHDNDIKKAMKELEVNWNTLIDIFYKHFSWYERLWIYYKSSGHFSTLLTILILIILSACIWIWVEYSDILIVKLTSIFTPLVSFFLGLSSIVKKGTEMVKEQSQKITDEINIIEETNESTALLRDKAVDIQEKIQVKDNEIEEIQSRLKVLKGQSVHDIVKDRVHSDKYESMLGIVHSAKKDLDTLRDAMFNKYYDDINDDESKMFPRGEPRIVIFIDDLDRCDPEKLVEILEALQLLVKSKLFVVVAAIDLHYLCSSLETRKYKGILYHDECPTGLDYLEKIFQISYRIPSIISKTNMQNYIDCQISVIVDNEHNHRLPTVYKGGLPDSTSHLLEETAFTSSEAQMLKETCVLFKLTPRATKRIVNVFRIIKQIHFLNLQSPNPTLLRHNLLLLVMAASGEKKIGMQKIFNMMEEFTMPILKSKASTDNSQKPNLSELIIENCSFQEGSGDLAIVNQLERYEFANCCDWRKVSENFQYALSFSFFRRIKIPR